MSPVNTTSKALVGDALPFDIAVPAALAVAFGKDDAWTVDQRFMVRILVGRPTVGLFGELRAASRAADTALPALLAGRHRGLVVVTHDREFTGRRRRSTVGLHVRLVCEQPDAVDVVRAHLDEMIEALERRQRAVVEVRPGGILGVQWGEVDRRALDQ